MHPPISLAAAVNSIGFFSGCSAAQLERIHRLARVLTVGPGQAIVRQGEIVDGLYGVISGRVEIGSSSADGQRFIRRFGEPGQIWGFLSVFDGQGSPYFYFAHDTARILFIQKSDFLKFLDEFPEVWVKVVRELTRVHRQTLQDIEELLFANLSSRLARLLLSLGKSNEDKDAPQGSRLKITQEQLAALLGVTRQSVSKELRALEAEGIIGISYRGISILDPARLRKKFPLFK